MTPSDSPVLTDDDLTPWVADLRSRVAGVDIGVPDLDELLARPDVTTLPTAATADRRRIRQVILAAAAVIAIVAGVTTVLVRDPDARVSTTVDQPSDVPIDPLAGLPLLGPAGLAGVNAINVSVPAGAEAAADYEGSVTTYLGGDLGGRARVVTVMSAPTGTTAPPFGRFGAMQIDFADWFAADLEGVPAGAAPPVPVTVDGAERALSVDLTTLVASTIHLIVAQGNGTDAVVQVNGTDDLAGVAAAMHLGDGGLTFDGDRVRVTPVAADGHLTSSTYSVAAPPIVINVTPMRSAAGRVGILQNFGNDGASVLRAGPDWVVTFDGGKGVAGVRDGAWVEIQSPVPLDDTLSPIERIDSLVRIDRAAFDEVVAATEARSAADSGYSAPQDIEADTHRIAELGGWIPTSLPDGAEVRTLYFSFAGPNRGVVGLPTVRNRETGAVVAFAPAATPYGLRIDEGRVGDLDVQIYRPGSSGPDGQLLAVITSAIDPAASITATSTGLDESALRAVLASVTWSDGWSQEVPPGWDAFPAPVAEGDSIPVDNDRTSYGLDLGDVTVQIDAGDERSRAIDLDSYLRFRQVGLTTVDGMQVYSGTRVMGGDEQSSVFVVGTDDHPSVRIDDSTRSVDELVRIATSVERVDRATLDRFVEPLSRR